MLRLGDGNRFKHAALKYDFVLEQSVLRVGKLRFGARQSL